MKFRTLAVAAAAIVLPLSAVACSDDSTGDLDVGEISEEIQKSGIPEEQADCVAQALKDADFTEDDLENFSTDPDSEKGKEYIEAVTDCVSDASATTTP